MGGLNFQENRSSLVLVRVVQHRGDNLIDLDFPRVSGGRWKPTTSTARPLPPLPSVPRLQSLSD